MSASLAGRRFLVTGIVDAASLALPVAREIQRQGGALVCAGLGPTRGQEGLSPSAASYVRLSFESFTKTVHEELGADVPCLALDVTRDESLDELAATLAERGLAVDGLLHSVALDRTIRGGRAKPLLEVSREEFLDCMSVSAWSLIGLVRSLLTARVLLPGSSVVSLSYLGAERVMPHPYRNVGAAKAALERITRELAAELGPAHGVRVNAIRFSPYAASRAGGAIPALEEMVHSAQRRAPLGNAPPESLAAEVAHLLRPGIAVTGEVRHVDGGYHVLG